MNWSTAAASFVHEAEDDSLTVFLAHASLEAGEHQAAAVRMRFS